MQIEPLFPPNDTAQYAGAYVTFQPGSRTAWHLHPAGQHMIVVSGVALTGTRDGHIIEFDKGDTVWCPSGIDHWYGATPDKAMTHLVITGVRDGENVVWKDKVTDAQYRAKQRQAAIDRSREKAESPARNPATPPIMRKPRRGAPSGVFASWI